MSAFSYSIGEDTFGQLAADADGLQGLELDVGNEIFSLKRKHSNGTDGNYIVRCGRIGQPIIATFRIKGSIAAAYAQYNTLKVAWANTAVTITDPAGQTYERCQVEPNGVRKIDKVTTTGRKANQLMFTVEARFSRDS